MKRIGIVVNQSKTGAIKVLEELKDWLTKRGLDVVDDLTIPREDIPKRSDAIIVLGGDGTLLNLAKFMSRDSGPILGVNLGGLGFLTETTLDELYPTLEKMLAGEYECSSRMMLEAMIASSKEKYLALNDIVITKSATSRILALTIRIDDEDVINYAGDGLIISTPTGSTAHALSAGSPIVYPTLDSFLITPIMAHTLAMRPLVVPPDKGLTVVFGPEVKEIILAVDGQHWIKLSPEDVIKVSTSPVRIKLVQSLKRSYWQILREKLGIK